MKKFLTALLAVFCTATLAFGLTACNNAGQNNNGNGNNEEDNNGNNATITINKDTKYEDIISDVITEEQWNSAFSAETAKNYTAYSNTVIVDGKVVSVIMKFDNYSASNEYFDNEETISVTYQFIKDNKLENYSKSGQEEWKHNSQDIAEDNDYSDFIFGKKFLGLSIGANTDAEIFYADLTYDTTTHAYVYEKEQGDKYLKHCFKFQDGKLVSVWVHNILGEDNEYEGYYLFYDYGTTAVEIPDEIK